MSDNRNTEVKLLSKFDNLTHTYSHPSFIQKARDTYNKLYYYRQVLLRIISCLSKYSRGRDVANKEIYQIHARKHENK